MEQADIVVQTYFFEFSEQTLKYSRFSGIITSETRLSGKSSCVNYTSRKAAMKGSMEDEENEIRSFTGYTARGCNGEIRKAVLYGDRFKKINTKYIRKLWTAQSKEYFSKEDYLA